MVCGWSYVINKLEIFEQIYYMLVTYGVESGYSNLGTELFPS